jgi:hypothetical protein
VIVTLQASATAVVKIDDGCRTVANKVIGEVIKSTVPGNLGVGEIDVQLIGIGKLQGTVLGAELAEMPASFHVKFSYLESSPTSSVYPATNIDQFSGA